MASKRRHLRSRSGKEEEEEEEEVVEDTVRRSSTRNKKRVKFPEDDDKESLEPPEVMSVTCGNKNGLLHVNKFGSGEACVKSQGRWFTPINFRNFGGKAHIKKWRRAIYYKDKPLQVWFEQGFFVKGLKRIHSEGAKQNTILSRSPTSVSPSKERKTKPITSSPKTSDLQMRVKVVMKRLPEATKDFPSKGTEHPSLVDPVDPPDTSDPPAGGGVEEENREEVAQSDERKEDGQSEIQTETPLCEPATSAPDVESEILNETVDADSTSSPTVDVGTSPMQTAGNNGDDASNAAPIQRASGEESMEAIKSEMQSAEVTKEDNVKDDDLVLEMALETEEDDEENVAAETEREAVDSGGDMGEEEGMEAESTPVAESDEGERKTKLITSTPKKCALRMEVKVVIRRLPEVTKDCPSNGTEHPSLDRPPSEDLNNGESECNVSAVVDPSEMSDPPAGGGVEEENGEEVAQSNETKEDGQSEIQTETPLCEPATSAPDVESEILNETVDADSTSSPTVDLGAGNNGDDASNTESIQRASGEESMEAINGGAPTQPPSAPVDVEDKNLDATDPGQDAAELQETTVETMVPPASDVEERPISTSCNLDTMDLDQLQREKIKMQLKVLRLQDEYYTLKIEGLQKAKNTFSGASQHGSAGASD